MKRRVILLADRWYAVAAFVTACQALGCWALIRLKCNRKLYRAAPAQQPKHRGAPRKHGAVFQGKRPHTHGPADAQWEGSDENGKRIVVSCWTHLHFREAPQAEVSVLRVQREARRFLWSRCALGSASASPPRTWVALSAPQDLLWDKAHVRTPEQLERWSWLLACVCKQRAVTPQQVRRAMPSILQQIGTPARAPKPRGPSPGWQTGRQRTPAPRFVVVRKPKPLPKTHRKRA